MSEEEKTIEEQTETIIDAIENETEDDVREVFEINKEDGPLAALGAPLLRGAGDPDPADPNMIQKHLDNFLAKIAGETPVDETVRDSTEYWLNRIAGNGGAGFTPVKIKKLWENETPTSSFVAQTVDVNFDGVGLVIVICRFSNSATSGVQPPAIFPPIKDSKFNCQSIGGTNQSYRIGTVLEDGIAFDAGKLIQYSTMSATDSNTNMIPLYIYGISF